MKRIVLLGAGLVGQAIARDLAGEYDLWVLDIDSERLKSLQADRGIRTAVADARDREILRKMLENADLAINALPGSLGTGASRDIIETGVHLVDIAFSPEDPFDLHDLALAHDVTAVVDCGVAPGLSNLILGHHHRLMDHIDSFECLVGGLPKERKWPGEYKAGFSPADVVEEYVRPARFVENGVQVVRPALSDPEYVHFPGLATLESFNTDGLRTLIRTMDIPNMKEKTLRYPGHIQLMGALRELGFFAQDPVTVRGIAVAPREFTSRILFPHWELKEGEADFTCMRVSLSGVEGGRPKTIEYNLYDEYDPETRTSSMARTTGYTCTAVARLVLAGRFKRRGICPPEYLGEEEGLFETVVEEIGHRGVRLESTFK